jgi:hypothetical protein
MRTDFVLVYCTILSAAEGYTTNNWMRVNNEFRRCERKILWSNETYCRGRGDWRNPKQYVIKTVKAWT